MHEELVQDLVGRQEPHRFDHNLPKWRGRHSFSVKEKMNIVRRTSSLSLVGTEDDSSSSSSSSVWARWCRENVLANRTALRTFSMATSSFARRSLQRKTGMLNENKEMLIHIPEMLFCDNILLHIWCWLIGLFLHRSCSTGQEQEGVELS